MADNIDPQQAALDAAPKAFGAWGHLRGAVSVALPASLKNADKLARSVMIRLGR